MKVEEKDFEKIISSVKGLSKAMPKTDLFESISIKVEEQMLIPKMKLLWMAAAAVIVLMINVYGFTNASNASKSLSSNESSTTLMRDFNFYDL